ATPDDAARRARGARAPQAVRHGRSTRERAEGVHLRRAVTLMLMTLVLPGSAQLVAGNKRVGRVALRIWLGLVALVVLLALVAFVWDGLLLQLGSNMDVLGVLRLLLVAMAVGWAGLFLDAWRIATPRTLRRNQRIALVTVNGVLCFSVVGGLLFSAHAIEVGRGFVTSVFTGDEVTAPSAGRYNVLLVGADAGEGRVGLRTDSMTLASIDKDSGRTVLVSLPRNMQNFPFRDGSVMDEQFPDGFDCEGCYLNGVTTWATDHADLFGASAGASDDELFEIGMDATISAVEGVTDLDVNYWAMVDMRGFEDLVDAVGGVELNVRGRIPIGGVGSPISGYIEPGVQQLNGYRALWFARSRADSDDYSRMARQKCVMSAMLQQMNPTTVLTSFGDIADAGANMLETSIPAGEIDRFVDLALKARDEPMSTVSIVPPAVNTADPDMDVVHQMIADGIAGDATAPEEAPATEEATDEATGAPADSGSGGESASDETVTGGSLGSRDEGYAANETADLGSAC
ncbi:MAG TPA: LCP family protein, partial [Nocardioides sp.]